MPKQTPYEVLNALSNDQLDVLLSLSNDDLNKMLVNIVYTRVAERLWANRPILQMKAQP